MAKGKTLEAFVELHDRNTGLRRRVQLALEDLGDSWEYEGEFTRRCRISNSDWTALAQQIPAHVVAIGPQPGHPRGRRIIAGTKAFAGKLRVQAKAVNP